MKEPKYKKGDTVTVINTDDKYGIPSEDFDGLIGRSFTIKTVYLHEKYNATYGVFETPYRLTEEMLELVESIKPPVPVGHFDEPRFPTKDSGKRKTWESGFNRDDDGGKLRYDLIPPMALERLAGLYTRGAVKYGDSNWKLAKTTEEIERFKQSAWRHFMSWQKGEYDEDHAFAVVWNIVAYEWHRENLSANQKQS